MPTLRWTCLTLLCIGAALLVWPRVAQAQAGGGPGPVANVPAIVVGINFDGQFDPASPALGAQGAIGQTRYIQFAGGAVAIYNRNDTVLAAGTVRQFLNLPPDDPIIGSYSWPEMPSVIWDPTSERF